MVSGSCKNINIPVGQRGNSWFMAWELWDQCGLCWGPAPRLHKKPRDAVGTPLWCWSTRQGSGSVVAGGQRSGGGSPEGPLRISHCEAGSSHLGEKMSRKLIFAFMLLPVSSEGGLLYELCTKVVSGFDDNIIHSALFINESRKISRFW